MEITSKDVMKLRQKSGLGIMDCKTALKEAGGDMELAEDNLRKKGLSKMDGRVDRESSEGCISTSFNFNDRSKCAIVQINTETDFTAKNKDFVYMVGDVALLALMQRAGSVEKTNTMQKVIDVIRINMKENILWRRGEVFEGGTIGSYVHHDRKTGVVVQVDGEIDDAVLHKICLHVAAVVPEPLGINDADISATALAKEREIAKSQAAGKPEKIAEKMVAGKIQKYLDSVVLLRQSLVMDTKMRIKDMLAGASIRQFVKYKVE